ncbi:hypothetical protein [Rhodoferax sp.]|uniref:hypothetical protein n=1 Tax=Rhodoferax sp. TaxID=50421 RepID=UPI000B2E5716|nr:hypothetical protein [Rhodoferax sp.]
MNTALVMKPDFLAPLRLLLTWLLPSPPQRAPRYASARSTEHCNAPHLIAMRADSTGARGQNSCKSKPLRVVRVLESGQSRSEVGRMVISGRMADVCAELDRLAACETA